MTLPPCQSLPQPSHSAGRIWEGDGGGGCSFTPISSSFVIFAMREVLRLLASPPHPSEALEAPTGKGKGPKSKDPRSWLEKGEGSKEPGFSWDRGSDGRKAGNWQD